ncbi:TonB-dependent receptor plug domain-containing protein [Sphingomonas sp. CJ20]
MYKWTFLLSAALVAPLAAQAQDATPQSEPAPAEGSAIVVTGTRFAGRTVTTSPVPIDVLSGEDVRASGYNETTEILRQQAPSFAFATPTTPDGNTHIHSASLRGLSPDETLVLLNGKRVHTAGWVNTGGTIGKGSVPTDLNQIPAASIGRVEILRDGASAQYGSDAIAGVINVLLRTDTAVHGTASFGSTYDGGGDTYEFSLGGGLKLPNDGFVNITGYYRDHKAANRAEPDTRQFYFGRSPTNTPQPLSARYGAGIGLNPPGGVAGTTLDPREATVDRNVWRFADQGDIKDASGILNFVQPLAGDTEVYGFGGYRVSKAHSNASFRRPGQDENVRALYPDGFLPFVNTESTDYSSAIGVRGALASWNWDVSTVYGGNTIEYRTENTLNATLGTASPTRFYNGKYGSTQWTTDLSFSNSFDAGLAGPLNLSVGAEYRRDGYKIGAGEPDSYAFGTARVLDGPNAGAVPTIGSQGFAGIQPGDVVDVHRDAIGAFAEIGLNPVRGWTVDLAGRYEHYSDFGDTWNGQASTRLELGAGFAVRGSAGTGFHAPALPQQYFSSTSSRTIINGQGFPDYVLVRTAPVGSALARALGAQDLKPEKSTSFGGGLTYAGGGLSASVDYYHIDIDDRIFLSSNYVDAGSSRRLRDYLASIGIPGVTSVRYFTNAADTRTEGVDVTVAYAAALSDWGKLRLTAAYNRNTTRLRRVASTPSQITGLGITTPLFDINERTRVEYGQPKDKVALGANLKAGIFTLDARTTRYGKVEQVALTNQSPANVALAGQGGTSFRTRPTESGAAGNLDVIQRLDPKWVTDISITGQLTKNVALTLGANNVFNVYPTENIRSTAALTGADTNGAFPYSEFSPFGFSGGYYYARIGVNF